MFFAGDHGKVAAEGADTARFLENARQTSLFAEFLDAPVGRVRDITHLAQDDIGTVHEGIDALPAFFLAAVVVQKLTTATFDQASIMLNLVRATAHTQDAATFEIAGCGEVCIHIAFGVDFLGFCCCVGQGCLSGTALCPVA